MSELSREELYDFLEAKYNAYNCPDFIQTDPIQIPHQFSKTEDIEITAFLTAAIAWGKRSMIIRSADKMIEAMGNNPHEFVLNYSKADQYRSERVGHRTFKPEDFDFFIRALQNIYTNYGGLQNVFSKAFEKEQSVFGAIQEFRKIFMQTEHVLRSEKHIANPAKNSAAKRLNMFLMWMIRNDNRGVHFGLWNDIPASDLIIPMDVHCGNTARTLGLISRKQNDRKAAEQLTHELKKFDAEDPVKYDFALFGAGVFEGFGK
jgi:uncharacterized protein (TIGR02757 family)